MDCNAYQNQLAYPRKADFTTTHYYKGGKVIATVRAGEAIPEAAKTAAASEKIVDEDAYRVAVSEYGKHNARLREQFNVDLLNDYGLPDNEFTRQLINIAYEDGHSSGYGEIYNCFGDLADLHELAQKVYGK